MKLAEISVRRPVFAIMMTAATIVVGAASYKDLGLDLMPKTDAAVVTVTVTLPGASAEEVETQVTKRIEEAVNTVSGIDELRATSEQGTSRVTITFTLERDIESATQDVRDKVATVVALFPRDAKPPVIQKVDPDSQPILSVSAAGPRSPRELTEIADKKVKQVLETLRDVGSVTLGGERKREIHLLLDGDRLNAYGLTVDQVRTAVARQNVEIPGSSFVDGSSEVALRTMGRIHNVDDFNRLVIARRDDGSVVTFADIGRVQDTVQEVRNATRLNGTPVVNMQVRKQSGANTVEVVDRVLAAVDAIGPTLPADVVLSIGSDQSRFIRQSFEEIRMHLVLGSILASVVVFAFMRNWRVTVIAALTVPTSILGAFALMRAFGFTLNNMTMLALSLATGIVIDDAIVVIENIFRFMDEKGLPPRQAAVAATAEIGLAVVATTLSLVVIFVPVAFMTGQIGRYFYSFGITAAAAILVSMFVSFTLTPALCALWLKPGDGGHGHGTTSGPIFERVEAVYGGMLDWALHHRAVMLGISGAVVASAVMLLSLRRQGARARRRPGRVHHQPAAAARDQLPADRRVRAADRERRIRAAGDAPRVRVGQSGRRELLDAHGAAGGARPVPAGRDAPGAAPAAQVPGRQGRRLGRHRHLRRLEPRPQRGRQQQADDPDPGAGHRTAPGLYAAADGARPHDPRRRRRRFQLRADTARAAGGDQPGARRRPGRQRRVAGHEPAHPGGRRGGVRIQGWRRSVRRAAPPGRALSQQPTGDRRPADPGGRGPHGACQRRGRTPGGTWSGQHRALQPPAPDLGGGEHRPRASRDRPGRGAGRGGDART